MVEMKSIFLVLFALCCSVYKSKSEPNITAMGTSNILGSGFTFELIMTKLNMMEHHFVEKDFETDEKIAILSSRIDSMVKSIEHLAWIAQQTGETVNQLGLNGKHIGQNLSVIQRDLTNVLAEQKLLVTGHQLREYLHLKGCNSTSMDLSESRSRLYASCNKVPIPVSGVYHIRPEKPFKEPITVFCDQEYDNGGWVVIQHRFDGSTNFYRNWQEYKNGFGNLNGEFWLGLDRIYQLTVSGPHELVILLEDFDGNTTYARYSEFSIGDESVKYSLTSIGGYSGTAGDSMADLKGMKFSTFDADNDTWNDNCAVKFAGAWWYAGCHSSNLNGKYLRGETKEFATSMVWKSFRGYHYSLKSSKMMIRPV
ncbi:ficolin-2-like [Anopheles nili]|uniref:ficolin-2-like n=1 Tax=Anopheles nili TaxID=185578 RepID=UPI00237B0F59|nr:ficolin-2-like [Anopheles nili]